MAEKANIRNIAALDAAFLFLERIATLAHLGLAAAPGADDQSGKVFSVMVALCEQQDAVLSSLDR